MGVKNEEPKKPSPKSWLYYYFIVLVVTMLLNALVFPSVLERKIHEVSYDQFLNMVEQGRVEQVAMQDNQISFLGTDEKGEMGAYKTGLWPDEELIQRLRDAGVVFAKEIPTQASPVLTFFTTWIMPILMFVVIGQLLSRMMMKRMGGMGNAMTFGKSNAKIYAETETGKTFADVAGEEEAKEALKEIVDFLHNPQKYADIGATLPKGALLVGPPGTGKPCWPRQWQGKRMYPSFRSPARSLWRCSWAWVRQRCGICSSRRMRRRPALCLSMRLIPSARSVTAAVSGGMTSGNRR